LAPLALIAVVGAFLMVVNGSGGTGDAGSSSDRTATTPATKKATTQTTSASKTTTAKSKSKADSTYTVQVGDTFGGIADKTGVPLDRLEELNPAVDAHAMTVGQKIKLK
jgi:LysM repeat protein